MHAFDDHAGNDSGDDGHHEQEQMDVITRTWGEEPGKSPPIGEEIFRGGVKGRMYNFLAVYPASQGVPIASGRPYSATSQGYRVVQNRDDILGVIRQLPQELVGWACRPEGKLGEPMVDITL